MVEENAGNNELVLRNFTQNETIHVPQGLPLLTLTPAAFLAYLAAKSGGEILSRAAGTAGVSARVYHGARYCILLSIFPLHMPSYLLGIGTGIPRLKAQSVSRSSPLLIQPHMPAGRLPRQLCD